MQQNRRNANGVYADCGRSRAATAAAWTLPDHSGVPHGKP